MKKLFLLFLLFPFSAHASAPNWVIDPAASSLMFDGRQSGQPFSGTFKTFGGKIVFDPDHLDQSHANITIDIGSIDAGGDGNQYVAMPQWFDTKHFPTAKFETVRFEKIDMDDPKAPPQFIAHAKLTIRDITLPVDLPFTLTFAPDGKTVKMQGAFTLNRLDYHLGTGSWADPTTVAPDVTVHVNLSATKS
jgi:cytochrome b561